MWDKDGKQLGEINSNEKYFKCIFITVIQSAEPTRQFSAFPIAEFPQNFTCNHYFAITASVVATATSNNNNKNNKNINNSCIESHIKAKFAYALALWASANWHRLQLREIKVKQRIYMSRITEMKLNESLTQFLARISGRVTDYNNGLRLPNCCTLNYKSYSRFAFGLISTWFYFRVS